MYVFMLRGKPKSIHKITHLHKYIIRGCSNTELTKNSKDTKSQKIQFLSRTQTKTQTNTHNTKNNLIIPICVNCK